MSDVETETGDLFRNGPSSVAASSADAPCGDAAPPSTDLAIRIAGPRVLQYIRTNFPEQLRRRHDPVDLYQATMFEAFRRAPALRHFSEQATLSWLLLLARRQIGMALRHEKRRKRGGPRPDARLDELLEEYATASKTASKALARIETMQQVQLALSGLPEPMRRAVTLRHLEGLSVAQVAEKIGRSESATASLCFRGLRALQRTLRSMSRFL